MSINFNRIAAAAIASAFAAPAFAGALYGGGATFPAEAYFGDTWIVPGNSANDARLTATPEAGSFFAAVQTANPGTTVSYCQTGSGFGRNMLIGVIPSAANPCPATFSTAIVNNSSSTQGFSGVSAEADFAGTDAPITATEFTNSVTNKGATRGQLIQFPSLVGTVAVVYNHSGIAAGKFKITEAQLCDIWRGTVTNFNQLSSAYPSKPITLVSRSDSSGTSFAFSNHLNYVCGSPYFTVGNFPAAYAAPVPTNVTSASGNAGVTEKVLSTDGAIGYVDFADGKAHGATSWALIAANGSTKYLDPAKNKKTFALPTTNVTNLNGTAYPPVVVDAVISGNDATYKRPIGTVALSSAPNGKAGCVWTIDPAAYATAPLVAGTVDYATYPIVSPTYLLAYNKGNAANLSSLKTLIGGAYNSTVKNATFTVGSSTGWSYLKAVVETATAKKVTTKVTDACLVN